MKKALATFLCLIMVFALLPATALAESPKYASWGDAIESSSGLTVGDTINIDGVIYKYGDDISSTGLSDTWVKSTPNEATVYKAGGGKVLWESVKSGYELTSGTLTFDSATIEVSGDVSVTAVTVPDSKNGINVVFKGTNSIKSTATSSHVPATVLNCSGPTTISLMPDSDTTLTAGDKADDITKGILCSSPVFNDPLKIIGSGKLTVNVQNNVASSAIEANHPVDFTGGTLYFPDNSDCNVKGVVTLGGVTIPPDNELHLEDASDVVMGTTGAVNNGMLVLPNGTSVADLKPTGSGYVKVMGADASYYTNAGDTIHEYQMLDFQLEKFLNEDGELKSFPTDANLANAGFIFAGDSTSGFRITLGNLLIEQGGDDTPAINLPDGGDVTLELMTGTTTRINSSLADSVAFNGQSFLHTIKGSGKLVIKNTTATGSAISANGRLTIEDGDITIYKNGKASYGINAISGYKTEEGTPTVNITGGKLNITADNVTIAARGGIYIASNMQITSPEGAEVVKHAESEGSPGEIWYYTIAIPDQQPAKSVVIEPGLAPSSGGGGYISTPAPVTVYNDSSTPNATVWLSGSGLDSSDLLVTERDPNGSAYKALMKLAGDNDVFATYNIHLKSGKKSTGNTMSLTFNLNSEYAGQDFTLVHQKADSMHEYFYDTADANGDLSFGPLYELSPFMLVKGTLTEAAANAVKIPATGDSSRALLWGGIALIGLFGAAAYIVTRNRA